MTVATTFTSQYLAETAEVVALLDTEAIERLVTTLAAVRARGDLAGYDVGGRFYEIGSPAGLEETRGYLSARGNSRS